MYMEESLSPVACDIDRAKNDRSQNPFMLWEYDASANQSSLILGPTSVLSTYSSSLKSRCSGQHLSVAYQMAICTWGHAQ